MKTLNTIALIVLIIIAMSCNKDKNNNLLTANFTIENDTIPYGIGSGLVFNFMNTSKNASNYRWELGGEYKATTNNLSQSYTSTDLANFFTRTVFDGGNYYTYPIKLVAFNGNDSSVMIKQITIIEAF